MTNEERVALAAMTDKFPLLDRWRDQLEEVYRPEPGSELATDDSDFPWSPTSQLAVAGLGSATQHLRAIRLHMEARELFSFAHGSLARSALLGAAQTVWLLEHDDHHERVRRARTMKLESYRRHLQWLEGAGGPEHVTDHVRLRRDEVIAAREADGDRRHFDSTAIIQTASEATYGERHPDLAQATMLMWRRTSGSAHGLIWSLLNRAGTVLESDGDEHGVAEHTAGGDLPELAENYSCAHWVAVKGWELLQRRGSVTQP